jgi:hypothetical protein
VAATPVTGMSEAASTVTVPTEPVAAKPVTDTSEAASTVTEPTALVAARPATDTSEAASTVTEPTALVAARPANRYVRSCVYCDRANCTCCRYACNRYNLIGLH